MFYHSSYCESENGRYFVLLKEGSMIVVGISSHSAVSRY